MDEAGQEETIVRAALRQFTESPEYQARFERERAVARQPGFFTSMLLVRTYQADTAKDN